MKQNAQGQWERDGPTALGPDRSFGGYYRSGDRMVAGKLFRGVPLQTAEDAVVAAVQLGYRVVDSQIDRGMRAAQRLRGAAERQGSGDPAQMLDAGERLANKALLAGLQWLESSAAEPGSPIKRLLSVEYDMLGSLFGLKPEGAGRSHKKGRKGKRDKHRKEEMAASSGGSDATAATRPAEVRIVHDPQSAKRAVEVRRWSVDTAKLSGELPVTFYPLQPIVSDTTFIGYVSSVDRGAVLRVRTDAKQPAGRWRAAVCADDGVQIGVIEIEL